MVYVLAGAAADDEVAADDVAADDVAVEAAAALLVELELLEPQAAIDNMIAPANARLATGLNVMAVLLWCRGVLPGRDGTHDVALHECPVRDTRVPSGTFACIRGTPWRTGH
jgi:hypothetical protein